MCIYTVITSSTKHCVTTIVASFWTLRNLSFPVSLCKTNAHAKCIWRHTCTQKCHKSIAFDSRHASKFTLIEHYGMRTWSLPLSQLWLEWSQLIYFYFFFKSSEPPVQFMWKRKVVKGLCRALQYLTFSLVRTAQGLMFTFLSSSRVSMATLWHEKTIQPICCSGKGTKLTN